MIGYTFAIILGVVMVVLIVAAMSGRGGSPARRAEKDAAKKPLQSDAPAADEPTPDRSATATNAQVASAKKHTPPA